MGHIAEESLEFDAYFMIRHRWSDERLAFVNSNLSASELWEYDAIEGESWFSDRIWTPNVFIENEVSTEVTSLVRENVFVRVLQSGEVQLNYR